MGRQGEGGSKCGMTQAFGREVDTMGRNSGKVQGGRVAEVGQPMEETRPVGVI